MIGIGLTGSLTKLLKWDPSALFFDGTSLGTSFVFILFRMLPSDLLGIPPVTDKTPFFAFWSLVAYVFGICVYITVTIPSLRTIVKPLESETNDARMMALSVLSAGNVIMIGCMLGVLCFQVRQRAFIHHLSIQSQLFSCAPPHSPWINL